MKTKSIQLSSLILLSLTLLNGCTPYSESFDCPPGLGVGCKSLSTVNQMVETGTLPLKNKAKPDSSTNVSEQQKPIKRLIRNTNQSTTLIEAKNEKGCAPGPLNILPQNTALESKPEMQLKVWIAAHKDEEGIYHASSYVYASLNNHSTESMEGGK